MPGRMEFEFQLPRGGSPAPRQNDPMKILLLGNFSGQAQPNTPIAQRKLHKVDIDNLEQMVGKTAPAITLQLAGGPAIEASLSEMDDFHPDVLFRKLDVFQPLRELRKRLHNSASYKDACAELRGMMSKEAIPAEEAVPDTAENPQTAGENDNSTLERLLGKPVSDTPDVEKKSKSAIEKLIGQAIAGNIVAEADPGQQVYFDAADEAIGQLMRQLLHHPDFQQLEAVWRSLSFLVSRLELDEELQLYMLDISKQEIAADLEQAGFQPQESGLYRLLVEQNVQIQGQSPWSLLVGHYRFEPSQQDCLTLAALGSIGSHAGGPFLAEASATMLGCDSLAASPDARDWQLDSPALQHWQALRDSELAPWIGLALPCMLARLPYGEDTDEIDDFSFEELTDPREHHALLWGNPAVGCAALIGQAFTQRGWSAEPGDILDIGDLPSHSYKIDGEWTMTPCAEIYLSESAATKVLEQGLMPLVSIHNSNAIRVLRFQSVSDRKLPLAGAWA